MQHVWLAKVATPKKKRPKPLSRSLFVEAAVAVQRAVTRALFLLCALTACFAGAVPVHANGPGVVPRPQPAEVRPVRPRNLENTEKREADPRAVESCRSAKQDVVVLTSTLACFRGLITEETIRPLTAFLPGGEGSDSRGSGKVVVINSPGGSITPSLELGRALYGTKVRLIVDQKCFSSCANYIVPAAFILIVWDKSLIAMHGSAPRRPLDFASMALAGRGIEHGEASKNPQVIYDIFKEFPAFHSKFVMEETRYFGYVDEDEYYLHRYFDIKRNLIKHAAEPCQPKKGLNIIIGPEYAEHFLTKNIGYFWWPEDTKEIFDLLLSYGMDRTIVLDMDVYPSWQPGVGFIDQSICVTVPSRKYGSGSVPTATR